MNITSDIFAAYLKCPTKCFLRAHGETGSGNEYADWVRTESESYRVEGIKRIAATIPPGDCVTDFGGTEDIKTAKWRLAVDFPAHAPIPYEEEVVERATSFTFASGIELPTCSAADLFIMKAFAARPKDWLDVEGIVTRQLGKLDHVYILRRLAELSEAVYRPEILVAARRVLEGKSWRK